VGARWQSIWSVCFQGFNPEAAVGMGKLAGLNAGILDRFQLPPLGQPGSSRLADRGNDLATSPAVILQVAMGKLAAKVSPTLHRGFGLRRGATCV
jgi:hypothetical protein